jgi:hypothetical protein
MTANTESHERKILQKNSRTCPRPCSRTIKPSQIVGSNAFSVLRRDAQVTKSSHKLDRGNGLLGDGSLRQLFWKHQREDRENGDKNNGYYKRNYYHTLPERH